MIAIRGAIRVERNDRDEIFRETQRLLREMERRNGLEQRNLVSAFFTMTPDLNADFPAYAAREMGWTEVPMLGAQETAVPGALDRMVRVLVHADTPGPARHVYLGEAASMRPDLAEEGDALRAPPVPSGATPSAPEGSRGRLLVVGLGLVGGSAALALRRTRLFREVLGHDLDPGAMDAARRAGAVDRPVEEVGEALELADLVLLATPVPALLAWLERWGGRLRRGSVVLDVGSTKRDVVRGMEALPEGVAAVGAHPMAGSEESGMGAARPDLFHGATWALVETERTTPAAREAAEAVVEAVGGRPLWTAAASHDRTVAATSHLPYLLSATLAFHLEERAGAGEPVRELLGPGAKDMLRLAGSDPTVLAGILATNWPEVRGEVEAFTVRLKGLAEELDARLRGDAEPGGEPGAEGLEAVLRGARRARRRLTEGPAEAGREPAGA